MSEIIRITKIFSFEAAHALEGYDGACRNIHGHSYKLSVSVRGKIFKSANHPKDGMVMDFKELKALVQDNIISVFDHSLILKETSKINFAGSYPLKIVEVPFQPTSENLISFFADCIKKGLPENLKLISLKLSETETSFVEWFESDQNVLT
jgi:6-pyruvoyltetrahydropterin/6-carboxytetrahydropterin synthase